MSTARLLPVLLLITILAACNRNQQEIVCAPLSVVTLVRVSQNESGQTGPSVIDNRYRIQALVEFANGRREEFSFRRKGLPAATTSATFYSGS